MVDEKELLMANSKEWLISLILDERKRHHEAMMRKISFVQALQNKVNALIAWVNGFANYGIVNETDIQ